MTAGPLKLLTFGPMIESELSRFLLERYRVDYVEERHVFGWASVLVLLHGGNGLIPFLYGPEMRLSGWRAIVDRYEEVCAPEQLLLPARQPLRTLVEGDSKRFNGQLGVFTARIAYYHLLPHQDILFEPFVRGVPAREAALAKPLYPLLRRLFEVLLQLTPATIADALLQSQVILEEAERRLADGRPFLRGDKETLADFTFATAMAPLLLPEGYTSPIPPYAEMPAELRAIVDAFRARPSAAFVDRIYALRKARIAAAAAAT